ncbi:PAS domain-containing sensor histidine kinase [Edaphobacillus lindanitolerans]|nr:PAS domain-containing sensor histidine kinase [Edaphobacillus lindanitolerans]
MMETFEFLFEDTDDAIMMVKQDSLCLRANSAAKSLFGISPGERMDMLLPLSEHQLWMQFLNSIKPGKKVTSLFNLRLVEGGAVTGLEATGSFFRQNSSVIVRFRPANRSRSGQTDFNPHHYSGIFRHALNCFVLFDRAGIIRDANNRTGFFFERPPESIIGLKVLELRSLFHDADNDYERMSEMMKLEGKAETKCTYLAEDGSERHYHIYTIFDEDSDLYVMTIRDDTEKVELKYQMERRENLSALGQLAASIAHEMKNGMTSIRGFTELIKISADETTMSYIDVIDSEMGRMEALMREFLLLSKPTSKEQLPFPLFRTICEVATIMGPQCMQRGMTIFKENHTDKEVTVVGNPQRMKQSLINLVKNAVEASERGTRLMLSIENYDDGHVLLAVTDEGKGMTELQLKQVFMPFFTTKREGTGLGLPFALETAELMGGHLFAKSVPNKGTRIEMLLPVASAEVEGIPAKVGKVI